MRISRQNKILELIEKYEIETQDKLVSMLREFGYDVTAHQDPVLIGRV